MKEIKFATKVAMKVTAEQYHRDLENPLLDMGYIYSDGFDPKENIQGDFHYLTNNYCGDFNIGFTTFKKVEAYYLIEDYNPQLFLALASMTEGEDWIVGEWLFFEIDDVLFKVKSTDGNYNDYTQGLATNNKYAKTAYRKATKEEIIKHFNKKVVENKFKVGDRVSIPYLDHDYQSSKSVIWVKGRSIKDGREIIDIKDNLIQFKGDTNTWFYADDFKKKETSRFPFKLTEEDVKRVINSDCVAWKHTLANKWGKEILLKGYVEVSDDFYNEMRSYCTDIQHVLFDDIFGKDEEFIPEGTPCLVRIVLENYSLAFADGKGSFYKFGRKQGETIKFKYYQVLDINNLPVNE